MTETYGADQYSGYVDETTGSEVKYRIKSRQYSYSNSNKLIRNIEYMKDAAGNKLSVNASYVKNSAAVQMDRTK